MAAASSQSYVHPVTGQTIWEILIKTAPPGASLFLSSAAMWIEAASSGGIQEYRRAVTPNMSVASMVRAAQLDPDHWRVEDAHHWLIGNPEHCFLRAPCELRLVHPCQTLQQPCRDRWPVVHGQVPWDCRLGCGVRIVKYTSTRTRVCRCFFGSA